MFDFLKSKAKSVVDATAGEATANVVKEAVSSFTGAVQPASSSADATRQADQGASADNASPASGKYEVKPGDSLSKIAKKHGISLSQIIAANPQVKNPDLIHPRELINLG